MQTAGQQDSVSMKDPAHTYKLARRQHTESESEQQYSSYQPYVPHDDDQNCQVC